ncbi:MAG: universal stress protein [Pseudomonadota bacterium]
MSAGTLVVGAVSVGAIFGLALVLPTTAAVIGLSALTVGSIVSLKTLVDTIQEYETVSDDEDLINFDEDRSLGTDDGQFAKVEDFDSGESFFVDGQHFLDGTDENNFIWVVDALTVNAKDGVDTIVFRNDDGCYMEVRGVEATEVRLKIEHGGPAQTLLAYCAQADPDVLVMGAFGRGKLGAMLFGSMTTAVLAKMTCPELISH